MLQQKSILYCRLRIDYSWDHLKSGEYFVYCNKQYFILIAWLSKINKQFMTTNGSAIKYIFRC